MGERIIMQLYCGPHVKELDLLLIRINVVASVLRQVVEFLGVLIDRVVPLAQN
jgi:hypothetical protein